MLGEVKGVVQTKRYLRSMTSTYLLLCCPCAEPAESLSNECERKATPVGLLRVRGHRPCKAGCINKYGSHSVCGVLPASVQMLRGKKPFSLGEMHPVVHDAHKKPKDVYNLSFILYVCLTHIHTNKIQLHARLKEQPSLQDGACTKDLRMVYLSC